MFTDNNERKTSEERTYRAYRGILPAKYILTVYIFLNKILFK